MNQEQMTIKQDLTPKEDILRLKKAVDANIHIDVTSEFFTKELLDYFKKKGVLNNSSHKFMVRMLQQKDNGIRTKEENARISAIVINIIKPYFGEIKKKEKKEKWNENFAKQRARI